MGKRLAALFVFHAHPRQLKIGIGVPRVDRDRLQVKVAGLALLAACQVVIGFKAVPCRLLCDGTLPLSVRVDTVHRYTTIDMTSQLYLPLILLLFDLPTVCMMIAGTECISRYPCPFHMPIWKNIPMYINHVICCINLITCKSYLLVNCDLTLARIISLFTTGSYHKIS